MSRTYIPGQPIVEDADLYAGEEDFLRPAGNGQPFHIGQSYEDAPAVQQECCRCGGTEFHLGRGSYYTAIRCVTCLWEFNVHEG
jgi:hypothetical protein